MIKVELIKDCVYHASSYVFDYKKEHTRVQEISNKIGKVLLESDYFQEIKEEADLNKEPEQPVDSEKTQQTEGDNNPPNNDGKSEG